jgi:hypothetical protein
MPTLSERVSINKKVCIGINRGFIDFIYFVYENAEIFKND